MQAARVLPPVTITVPRKRRPSLGPLTSQKLLQEPSLLDDGAASVLAKRVRHFVPRCVLRRVVDCGPIDAAEIVRLQGAVGFFDISGFTKLGSDLAHAQNETRRGSFKGEGRVATALSASHAEGAELLTTQLNGMFTGVLGVIRKHGGDVIKFVGDAMITMRNTNEKLGIHIGLAMGDVMSVVCGGFEGRYEAFICGPACDACYAADDAKKGEVIAPRAMWERLRRDGGEADDRETSAALVRIVAFPELELAAPEADPRAGVREAVAVPAGPRRRDARPRRGGARSSVRRLALIFMAVGGLQHGRSAATAKPDAATNERRDVAFLKAIQRALLGVQAAAAAHGAILRQFVRDDKGFVAGLAVGLPSKHAADHGDPSCVALGICQDFRKRVPVVSRATRVGVTVGDCFCGPVGATPEAARPSPRRGASSRRRSRRRRRRGAAAAARLCDAGEVVDALVVAGGAGQGKTALLEDVANRLREAGGLALYGSCREDDRRRPLSSVRGLVAGAVRFLLYRERTPESATRSLVPPRTDFDADRELATTFSSVDKLLPHEGDAPLCSSPLSPEQRNRRRRSYGDEPPDLDREAPTFESRASLAEASRDGGASSPPATAVPPLERASFRFDDSPTRLPSPQRRALIDEAVELVERTQRPRRRTLRAETAGAARVVLAHRPLATKRTRAFDALLRALNADGGGRLAASPRTGRSSRGRRRASGPRAGSRLLRGGQYRVHPGGDDGEAPIATVEVALGPLSFVEMRQLVGVAAEGWRAFVDVQFALVEFLLERSSGNPFVALELLHELLGRRVAAVDGATGELRLSGDASGAVGVPSAVAAAVSGAFDTLDSACQAALRLAAALGHRADVACLAYLFDYFFPEDGTSGSESSGRADLRGVAELVRRRLPRAAAFKMVTADRRKVHRQIVCWQTFRLVKNESSPGLEGDVAFHALCSDQPLLAFHFCVLAFGDAVRDGRVDVALGFCDDCALISENHALPAALCAFAQIGLMRGGAAAGTTAAHWTPWTRSARAACRCRPAARGGRDDAALEAFTAEASRGRA
ncbi:phosphatidylinositol kinase [Aureococcus anophagefferens]|nr:phosphatidylinositol kinase [Aureococcus anophagefferens]